MRALLTGASSFTGFWFAAALANEGFALTATCRRRLSSYEGLARARLDAVPGMGKLVDGLADDGSSLATLLHESPRIDLLCLHGATVGDYRARDFDALAALAADTSGLDQLLDMFIKQGGRAVLVTGSIFEADAGRGTAPRGAFNPYGLAKTLSWHTVRFAVESRGLALGKLVIANPFGPLEKPSLTSSLAGAWHRGEIPEIQQPRLVRDFVPIDGLALAYASFARKICETEGTHSLTPSGFAEPTALFVERFASSLRAELGIACQYTLAERPKPVQEPLIRVGIDPLEQAAPGWEEGKSWRKFSGWYGGTQTVWPLLN